MLRSLLVSLSAPVLALSSCRPAAEPDDPVDEPRADAVTTASVSASEPPAKKKPVAPPPAGALQVRIDDASVLLDEAKVVDLPSAAARAQGFDPSTKAHGASDMVVTPIGRAAKASRAAVKDVAVLAVPESIPYRIFFETLYTLQASEVRGFYLRVGQGEPSPIRVRRLARLVDDSEKLDLTLTLRPEGISLSTALGPVGAGCQNGSGTTFPRASSGALDLAAVAACAKKLKTVRDSFAQEEGVTVRAAAATPMGEVDALVRSIRPVFSEVAFQSP